MLSSGAAEVLRKLVRFAGEYYRIELRLRRTDPKRWEIVYAGWEAVPITDLFPESLNILKKIFPGL